MKITKIAEKRHFVRKPGLRLPHWQRVLLVTSQLSALLNARHADPDRPKILLGRLPKRLSAAFFGDAQVFLGLWKVGMKT
jgi:hypothetical protein